MAISTIDKELLKYFNQLDDAQKKSFIALIKNFVKKTNEGNSRVGLEEYNKELDAAMEERRKGEIFTHDEILRLSSGW